MDESRDFQLLMRLIDLTNNGIHFDTMSMVNLIDPMKIKSEFLPLYASKVGFFPRRPISDTTMRYILSAFPYIIKNKGSITGIKQAIATILKAEKKPEAVEDISVAIVNKQASVDVYRIEIYIPITLTYNKVALEELLKYIVPTGYAVVVYTYQQNEPITIAEVTTHDFINGFYANATRTSGVVGGSDYRERTGIKKELIGAYDTSEIIGSEQYNPSGNETNGDFTNVPQ